MIISKRVGEAYQGPPVSVREEHVSVIRGSEDVKRRKNGELPFPDRYVNAHTGGRALAALSERCPSWPATMRFRMGEGEILGALKISR